MVFILKKLKSVEILFTCENLQSQLGKIIDTKEIALLELSHY